jgi:hypothetical protein
MLGPNQCTRSNSEIIPTYMEACRRPNRTRHTEPHRSFMNLHTRLSQFLLLGFVPHDPEPILTFVLLTANPQISMF